MSQKTSCLDRNADFVQAPTIDPARDAATFVEKRRRLAMASPTWRQREHTLQSPCVPLTALLVLKYKLVNVELEPAFSAGIPFFKRTSCASVSPRPGFANN